MDKRTRVFNAMDKKPVDHVPVGFWYHFDDEHSMGESCVQAHVDYVHDCDLDLVKVMCDGYFPYPVPEEIREPEESFKLPGEKDFTIHAYRVNHNVTCYCYAMTLNRTGKFDVARAEALNIPKPYWNRLQKGETIETEKGVLTPDMVLGAPRKGLKVGYCTDSRPCEGAVKAAQGADLFICEGMYGEEDKISKAKEHKHMTFCEAAQIARKAKPEKLWLTHYSPSLTHPDEFMPAVWKIFPAAAPGKDGKSIELQFEQD
jgi:ribonuclease Z